MIAALMQMFACDPLKEETIFDIESTRSKSRRAGSVRCSST